MRNPTCSGSVLDPTAGHGQAESKFVLSYTTMTNLYRADLLLESFHNLEGRTC
jgi:hypothetical protein